MPKYSSWILFMAVVVAVATPASSQTQAPPDPGAAANVKQSQQYEQVLQGNSAFRAKRMQQECGPITDPQLHASCVASFGGDTAPPGNRGQR